MGADMDEAMREVMGIAEGLDRAAIEARARRVMAAANEARARYGIIPVSDFDRRVRHSFRAIIWSGVLEFLDEERPAVFSEAKFRKWESGEGVPVMRRPWAAARRLGALPREAADSLRVLLGREPYAFYEPWGAVTDAPPFS